MTRTTGIRSPSTLLALLALVAAPACARDTVAKDTAASAAARAEVRLSFKLDPRLSDPTYGGERWVATPTYTAIAGQDTVEMRAEVLDPSGARTGASPRWIASSPDMVTVSPVEGDRVKLTVRSAGESKVNVVAPDASRELVVKARYEGQIIHVEIAQGAAPGVTPSASKDSSSGIRAIPDLPSEKDRLSYAVGMSVGEAARKQSSDLDPSLVARGMADALSGKETLLSEAEAQAVLMEHQRRVRSRQSDEQARTQQDIALKNAREGKAFLAENAKRDGVVTLPSGLQYKVLRPGHGQVPTEADTVECHYRVSRIDGVRIDGTSALPVALQVRSTVAGFQEALKLMPVGSKWELFVPSRLAYGAKGFSGGDSRGSRRTKPAGSKVGPNTTLVFEVELVGIRNPADVRRPTTTAARSGEASAR